MRESFEHADILPEGKDHMPIAEIILMCGFLLIYFIGFCSYCLLFGLLLRFARPTRLSAFNIRKQVFTSFDNF